MPNLIEFAKDIENAEHALARILHPLIKKYNLPKVKIHVNLQDLREFSPSLIKEIYGDLIVKSAPEIRLGVSVSIVAEFVPTHVSHYYRYWWQAWLGYWWFKLKKANPTQPISFYVDFWEATFWEIEVPK